MTVKVKNVSPFGDLDLPGLGRVKAGAEIDVADDIAGTETSDWRPATADDPAWLTRTNEDGSVEAYTPGTGLLGGIHFVRVTKPSKSNAADTADQK